ncbi:MAG: polymerase sigma-70 factor, partial [Actinomycetia bacterium]|nr:polymerase sigma-70 factor [Actinomycetes bacterium]
RFPVDVALQRQLGERFVEVCAGGDLEGLLALLDPDVEGAGDVNTELAIGAADVAPGILRYLGPPASPTLLHLPVGDRVGIVAMRDHRVLALVLLRLEDGLVVHVDALTGEAPRAAVSSVLGLSS